MQEPLSINVPQEGTGAQELFLNESRPALLPTGVLSLSEPKNQDACFLCHAPAGATSMHRVLD